MTLWQFQACMDGWKAANSAEDKPPSMTNDELAVLGVDGF